MDVKLHSASLGICSLAWLSGHDTASISSLNGRSLPVKRLLLCMLVGLTSVGYCRSAFSFEFTHSECEFKVNFPVRPSVKKVIQPLGQGRYSNTYMAKAGDRRTGRVFSAQCDTSLRFAKEITVRQKQQMAELSIRQWAKMVNLQDAQMFWEQQGGHETLRMIGQRVLIEAGRRLKASFQARVYLGRISMLTMFVAEPASLSPSVEMKQFLDHSVQLK